MTDVARLHSILGGLHANAADFSTFPVSTVPFQHLGPIKPWLPRARGALEHNAGAVDGRGYPDRAGPKDLADLPLSCELKGANSNSGGAVSDWEAKLELGTVLRSIFGAVATTTSGSATTCSGTAGATLTVTDGTNIPTGAIILFSTTTGSFVRRVTSGGGTTTLTLDRAASGTASGTVIRLGVYTLVPGRTAHTHMGFDVEGTTVSGSAWRQKFLGCAPKSARFNFPQTGICTLDTVFAPTDWSQSDAAASPSFTAPTAGEPIPANGCVFADASFGVLDLAEASLDIDNGVVMRPTISGPEGVRGGVAANKRGVTLTGYCYLGGSSPAQQMTYANAKEWLASVTDAGAQRTTRALSLQLGTEAGAVAGFFMPEASVSAELDEVGGLVVVRFTAKATGATPLVAGFG